MTYKCRQSNNHNHAEIEGKGRTEAEELVNTFARQADITTEEGFTIMANREDHGVDTNKAATFAEAVRAEYGSLDCLQYACEAVTPGSTAPAPKVA